MDDIKDWTGEDMTTKVRRAEGRRRWNEVVQNWVHQPHLTSYSYCDDEECSPSSRPRVRVNVPADLLANEAAIWLCPEEKARWWAGLIRYTSGYD